MLIKTRSASVIIPTFNGALRIGSCLAALIKQGREADAEIIVVDDGSNDRTAEVVRQFPGVRLIRQANAGPAAARNRGAQDANGEIVLFTDDDCVPAPNWIKAMLEPFRDAQVAGSKGTYRTKQKSVVARFVQLDYEDRYRRMARLDQIDFVDTYSAAFRRDRFLEMGGYDTDFPVACAEDAELSYRMARRGSTMKFVPRATVYHTHPDSLASYLRKKYKFALWRMLALRKNPDKALKDSHTPQIMKLQLLLLPSLFVSVIVDLMMRPAVPATALVLFAFFCSTLPFAVRAARKDPLAATLSPGLLAMRACAQFFGVTAGAIRARNRTNPSLSTASLPSESTNADVAA